MFHVVRHQGALQIYVGNVRKILAELSITYDRIFLVESFFAGLTQKEISPFTSIHENKCSGPGFELIKMIYKHCPILFYSTVKTSALRLWWLKREKWRCCCIVVVVAVVVVVVDVVGHQRKPGAGVWLITILISRQ